LINFSGFLVLLLGFVTVGAIDFGENVEICAEHDDMSVFESSVITVNGVSCNSEDFRLYNQSDILGLNVSYSDFVLELDQLKMSRLNEICACGNQIKSLDAITNETFPNLSVMNFSHNSIRKIRRNLFKDTRFLVELDLSFNCLTEFPFKELLELDELRLLVLNLQGNFILSLDEIPLLEDVVLLSKLDLSQNHLSVFNTTNLHVNNLILRYNKIKSVLINVDVAYNASVKFGIDAAHNQIERFESKFEFKVLDLTNNFIKKLQNISVSGVEVLNLTNNLIKEISDNDFQVLSNFDKYVTPQGFKKFRDCSTLDLSGNKITSINYENFKSKFPSIKRLIIKRNNFPGDFLEKLQSYSKSESRVFDIVIDDLPPSKSSHLEIWGFSILISLIVTSIIMLIIVKRKNLQKLKYSGFFITFTDRERLHNEDF
jgi:Leucine-rich repeat (LRR) protein